MRSRALIATILWYEDDGCDGSTCGLGAAGLTAFIFAGLSAGFCFALGALCTLADVLGLVRLPERSRLGHRPRLDRLAAGISIAIVGGYAALVLIDDLNGL